MKSFMDKNFLLQTETAKKLYHDFASGMPIFDYHCHVSAKEIFEDKQYENITQVWLYGDHYKWRAMRLYGIDETLITGKASDYDKFLSYAKAMPSFIGNPVYHWTHLELQRYFDINVPLTEKSADEIWSKAKQKLQDGLTVRQMIKRASVTALCTTDDPVDELIYHKKIKQADDFDVDVLPTFRPDKGIEIGKDTFLPWVMALSNICKTKINSGYDLLKCLVMRLEYFNKFGCVVADHGIEKMEYEACDEHEFATIFKKRVKNHAISTLEIVKFKTYLIQFLGKEYKRLNWVMQLHMGAIRNNNDTMMARLGPDTGYDSVGDYEMADAVANTLKAMNRNGMPKVILYTLNPKDNYSLGTMMGNFPEGEFGTHVQFGCAWWFNDHIDGMEEQLKAYANLGVLPKFVGMLTDSRSFLSYTRHEYFRRILCNLLGTKVENGEYPYDLDALKIMVKDICYNNAVQYFKTK